MFHKITDKDVLVLYSIKALKGFSHRKLIFDMLFPLNSYAKKFFTVW